MGDSVYDYTPEEGFLCALYAGRELAAEALKALDSAGGGADWFSTPHAWEAIEIVRLLVAAGKPIDLMALHLATSESRYAGSVRNGVKAIWSTVDKLFITESTARANLQKCLEQLQAAARARQNQTTAAAMAQAAHDGDIDKAQALARTLTPAPAEPAEPQAPAPADDEEKPFPRPLLSCPGFVDVLAAHIGAASQYPNATADFFGALAALAHMAGRRYILQAPGMAATAPAEYFIMLGRTSSGKDNARKAIKALFRLTGWPWPTEQIGSGEGVQDRLFSQDHGGELLLLSDEFDGMLRAVADNRQNPFSTIGPMLLTWYTSATSSVSYRALSKRGGKKHDDGENDGGLLEVIDRPAVTLYATATPECFYPICAGHDGLIAGGLLGRCLVIQADRRGRFHETAKDMNDFPGTVTADAGAIFQMPTDAPRAVAMEGDALTLHRAARERFDAGYERNDRKGDAVAAALHGRALEHLNRLATLAAISRDPRAPVIDASAVRWAADVIDWAIRRTVARLDEAKAESAMSARRKEELGDAERVRRYLRERVGQWVKRATILRNLHKVIDAEGLDKAIKTLLAGEEIIVKPGLPGQTPTEYTYALPPNT